MPNPPESPGELIARQLQNRGISDPRVLEAFRQVPRHLFVPESSRSMAWEDRALPISCEQTISQPYMVALMTQELALAGEEKVLEIGTGSGYQTAILALLAREIYTVERHENLSVGARLVLDELGITNVHFRVGDGTLGWPDAAPFDRVLVTAAAPEFPQTLFDQLAEGGRLVAPIGTEDQQQLHVIERRDGQPVDQTSVACRFVPLVGTRGWDGHRSESGRTF